MSSVNNREDFQAHAPSLDRGLTGEQIFRLAKLVADGETEFPDDLTARDQELLVGEVRKQLRIRLKVLVARSIAHDIERQSREGRVGSHPND